MKRPIYLDHHATTPVDPRVFDAMAPYFCEAHGNAGSTSHAHGWEAAAAVASAREQVAGLLGADSDEVLFSSGATESSNLALLSTVQSHGVARSHVVTVVTEHPATLDTLAWLESQGARVTRLEVDSHGCFELSSLEAALQKDTVLVSLMMANNEIGTLHPVAEVGALLQERGIRFHCDAAQAVGRVPVDVAELGVDLLSLSGHKFNAPKGVGALYVKRGMTGPKLRPLHHGGGQEKGLFPGTTNVPGVVGLGAAAQLAAELLPAEMLRLAQLRDELEGTLVGGLEGLKINGHPERRLPGNLSVAFQGLEAEALMLALPQLALSAGSACSTELRHASHVLRALGLTGEQAGGTLRFGLGRTTSPEDIKEAGRATVAAALKLGARAKKAGTG